MKSFFPAVKFLVTAALALLLLAGCAGGGTASKPASRPEPRAEAPARPSPALPPVRQPEPSPPAQENTVPASPPAIGALKPEPQEKSAPSRPPPRVTEPAPPVRRTPPPDRTAQRDDSLDVLLGKSPDMSARESSSAASIRGLSPLSQKYGRSQGVAPAVVDAVKQMEQFRVSRPELERFLKEGGLRPPRR